MEDVSMNVQTNFSLKITNSKVISRMLYMEDVSTNVQTNVSLKITNSK